MRFFGIFKITIFKNATVLSGTGVGGGSLVYANTLPRPQNAFYESGNWAGLANWKDELAPHYTEAERMLGAAENPKLFDADNVLVEVAKSYNNEKALEPTNVSVFFGEPEKVVPDPFFDGEGPEREGCSFCGGCMTGCRHNAKNSLDKNYLHLAQKKGTKVEAERLVTKVLPAGKEDGSDGYLITHQSMTAFRKGKTRKTVKAKGVIFSGGVLGTMSLLMDLKHKKHLPNLSDALGDHVRTNNENLCFVVSKKSDKDYSKGIAIGAIFPPNSDGHVEVVRYRSGSGFWKVVIFPMVFNKSAFIRLPKLLLKIIFQPWHMMRALLASDFAKQSIVLLFMQHLDSTLKLKKGWFFLKSSHSSGPKVTPFLDEADVVAKKAAKIMKGKTFMLSTDMITGGPSTAHILGGAVIGKNANAGVIDSNHQVYGYQNMMVCDGSAVSANPGVNPSLTITAMSERAMSKIPAKDSIKQSDGLRIAADLNK